ncbi:tetratricopeptide repeat protein [Cerasicoccus arenae]|uniref:Tetratricopeptide repeat protein n=2 Tax=Cerasicoccus arenae TaxID=424488 RepID=A0A8J3GBT2_9BACT|nr:hypothetical protein GCM10007047_05690 [Cerasicoccus arenae]
MPHNQITYADILLAPVDMRGLVKKQGKTQILQARDNLKNGQVMDAFYKYRSGIRRLPDDLQARLELSQFFVAAGFMVEATDLLVEGLDYGFPNDPNYINQLLALTQHTDNNPALLKAIPTILRYPEVASNKASRVALMNLLLRAQIVERDYAGVIETSERLNEEELSQQYHDSILFAYLRMGSYDDATQYMESLPEEVAAAPNLVLIKGYLLQAQDDDAGARRIFHRLFRDHPNAWRSHLDAVMLLLNQGDEAAADSLIDLYLAVHRRNGSALTGLAGQLTDLPDSTRVMRVIGSARTDAPELVGSIWFYYVQALMTEGKFAKAKAEMDKLSPAAPKDPAAASIFKAYDHILNAAIARSAGEYATLVKYLETNRLNMEIYWEAGEAMRKIGAYDTAELALNAGLTEFPFSQSLSELRKTVLKEQSESDMHSRQTIASVKSDGYQNQRIHSDPLQSRLVGDKPETNDLQSLIGDEKLQGIKLTDEDLRKSDR